MVNARPAIGIDTGLKIFIAFVAVILLIAAGTGSFYTVDAGEKAVVLTFGEISSTADAGLHFKLPFIQTVKKFNVRVQKATFGRGEGALANQPVLSAYSYDQQIIESYRLSITWSYDADKIDQVYKYFGTGVSDNIFHTVISPVVQQSTKTILGQYTAVTIVQDRAKLDHSIAQVMEQQLKEYPVKILSIQLEDVNFSKNYESIIEQTAQKKQEVETARNELQKVQIESQKQVAQAEAENKAIKLQADAEAYRITVQAKAEADAIRLKGDALRSNRELVDLTIAEKWDGSVPQTVVASGNGSSVVPLLNIGKSGSAQGN
ncbi:MAG: prohibitin family protein [Succinivibrionaceae bacterium]|jgi:regulator of protease activity HflC (stomatin/prohibitin superfamily)|nr:prohibitin family protein [Pseudomonadota bacterium]MDY3145929.1 prohibitin family protein [Succinivibrionaceae bacterium]MDD6545005.1 prohibitin family protein [Pseudomonadota bacterium]MDY6273725.1 prohibitin family protein [Succinivibrionaceae bacterium]MDY6336040.1 prohibitin family protein [Succinivibrionaceae bacterium]